MRTALSHFRVFLSWVLISAGLGISGYLLWIAPLSSSSTAPVTLHLVDVSQSMGIEDIWSMSGVMLSRLDLAREILRYTRSGEDIIVSFARSPQILLPHTSDPMAYSGVVNALKPTPLAAGSDPITALARMIELYSTEYPRLTLSLLSDGGWDPSVTGSLMLPEGWTLRLILIGSEAGGKIPLGYNADGSKRYRYYQGREVIVPRSEELQRILESQIDPDQLHISPLDAVDQLDRVISNEWVSLSWVSQFSLIFSLFLLLSGYFLSPYRYVTPLTHHE